MGWSYLWNPLETSAAVYHAVRRLPVARKLGRVLLRLPAL
jgi:hypothetical protein